MSQKTYYVEKTGTYHTYEFLKKRQDNPKWREAYVDARKSRVQNRILTVIAAVILIEGLMLLKRYGNNELSTPSISTETVSKGEAVPEGQELGTTETLKMKKFSTEERREMGQYFLDWADQRGALGGMAVNSEYFQHGVSGLGDWYASTPDGFVLVGEQTSPGRPGFDAYSIHAVSGVVFYYSLFGTLGQTDELNEHQPSLATGFANVADTNYPIVKYLLCDNGKVYEFVSTPSFSSGFYQADDQGEINYWPKEDEAFFISEDQDAQEEWRRILIRYQ